MANEIAKHFEAAKIRRKYNESTIRKRIEAFFLDNIGKVATREQIIEVARYPDGRDPENWAQRITELRVNEGYTIQTNRDRKDLRLGQYLMPTHEKRKMVQKRISPSRKTWASILKRAGNRCEWIEDGIRCSLKSGDVNGIGGGKVKLTPDHKTPHSINPAIDPDDPDKWRALCGRHQVTKKNFWDDLTGKINYIGIMQAASAKNKRMVYEFLKSYFKED